MKKIILLLFIPFVLTSCSVKSCTPIIEPSFNYDVKYIMGDFCFNCNVTKNNDTVTVFVKDTNASGLQITYDGQNLEFKKNELSYKISSENIERTNPAIIFSDIFNYIVKNVDTCVKKAENGYVYTGNICIGQFNVYQNFDNEIYLITVPDANIKIELTKIYD